MPAIEVTKLKLRCASQERDRTRFAIEDSLRTSIPDERRLVLLRKMRITGSVSLTQPAERNAAIRDGWLAAISGARHGGDDGAADANCVWFASRDEALALLLSRLLAGKAVDAWYWKLAIPDWQGRPWRSWASECLSEAIGQAQDSRVLAIVQCFVAAGATEALIEALTGPEAAKPAPIGTQMLRELQSSSPSPELHEFAPQIAESAAALFATSMPPELRRAIVMLASKGGEPRAFARAIVRAWVSKRSPALALSPVLLAGIVGAVFEAMTSTRTRRARLVVTEESPPSKRRSAKRPDAQAAETAAALSAPEPSSIQQAAPRPAPEDVVRERPEPESQTAEEASAPCRFYSDHAGLWLVVPSLVELGFRDWLAERPRLLGEDPASQLLREIARHHRVPPDDMTLAALGPPLQPDVRPEWTRLWRHALDGWLRRTVKRRLHDLVNRPGELQWSELELVVHYPAADADLALRRLALDRDPGWTDWLGLSIRYNFGGTEDWL